MLRFFALLLAVALVCVGGVASACPLVQSHAVAVQSLGVPVAYVAPQAVAVQSFHTQAVTVQAAPVLVHQQAVQVLAAPAHVVVPQAFVPFGRVRVFGGRGVQRSFELRRSVVR